MSLLCCAITKPGGQYGCLDTRGQELPLFLYFVCSLRSTYNVIKIFTLKHYNLEAIIIFLVLF